MATKASKLTLASAATFCIEKGVPVPRKATGGPSGRMYPFADMEVGDSFFVSLDGATRAALQGKVSSNAVSFAKTCKPPRKFTTRSVEGGVRVWRIA